MWSILRTAWCAIKCGSCVNVVLAGETDQRHVLGKGIVGNQQIIPGFPIAMHGMMCRVITPLHSSLFLRLHLGVEHVIAGFGLEHVDAVRSFSHKIWLVFQVVGT